MIYALILSFISLYIFWRILLKEDSEFTIWDFFNYASLIDIISFLFLIVMLYLLIAGGWFIIYDTILTSYHRNHPCDECRFIQYEKKYFDKQHNEIKEFEYKWDHCKTLNWF